MSAAASPRAAALGGGPTVGGLGDDALDVDAALESSRAWPSRSSRDAIFNSCPVDQIIHSLNLFLVN